MAGHDAKTKPAAWRYALGIVLRTAHLAAVCLLAAQILGAGGWASNGAVLTLGSGIALFASELADRRMRLVELGGAVVMAKLALVGWMAVQPAVAPVVFWIALAVSGLVSHAPRWLRHWRPR